jgi:hypothetical protein
LSTPFLQCKGGWSLYQFRNPSFEPTLTFRAVSVGEWSSRRIPRQPPRGRLRTPASRQPEPASLSDQGSPCPVPSQLAGTDRPTSELGSDVDCGLSPRGLRRLLWLRERPQHLWIP